MSSSELNRIFDLYKITEQSSHNEIIDAMVQMCGDANFKIANYILAHKSPIPRTFAYHIDQTSTVESAVKDQAHHAIDLSYVFLNARADMTKEQVALAEKMALDWLTFANTKDPWEPFNARQRWMIYGGEQVQHKWDLLTEDEDEATRNYTRTEALLREKLYGKLLLAIDDIGYERYRLP
jgi:carboxylesterase type B